MALPGLNQDTAGIPTKSYHQLMEEDQALDIDQPEVVDEDYGVWSAGRDQAQGLGFRFIQMVGDLFDIESLEDIGERGAEENMALSAAYKRQALLETEGMSTLGKWVTDTVQTQIPMMLPSIVAGGAAAVLASFAGLGALATSAAIGAAAYVPNFVLNSGESYAKQLEAKGNISAGAAAVTGAFAAILDTLVPGKIAGRIFASGKGNFSQHIAKKLADGSAIGNRFKQAFKFSMYEGVTE